MAKDVKKDPQDLSVEEKLKALYQLQTMLSEIDKLRLCAVNSPWKYKTWKMR